MFSIDYEYQELCTRHSAMRRVVYPDDWQAEHLRRMKNYRSQCSDRMHELAELEFEYEYMDSGTEQEETLERINTLKTEILIRCHKGYLNYAAFNSYNTESMEAKAKKLLAKINGVPASKVEQGPEEEEQDLEQ